MIDDLLVTHAHKQTYESKQTEKDAKKSVILC
jgi:hypothetical protein